MYMRLKSIMKSGGIFLLMGSSALYAQTENIVCPSLSANEVQSIIDSGTISTNQGYTLADEAGMTRAQVLINEPTANPFDTYYAMMGSKNFNHHDYFIYIGNVLGKADYEAKERAKKILLSDASVFSAEYDPQRKLCMYKEINASSSISGYPFKSTYESVVLWATVLDTQHDWITSLMRKKRRA